MITRKEIERLISDLKNYMYPNYFDNKQISKSYIKKELNTIFKKTNIQDYPEDDFLNELENIKKELEKDIEAFYEGDPASTSKEEIIITYPGFLAIMIYRIAHVLYKIKMARVPRMMTEIAHSKTGIDIHPGATIGSYFFIDHGTGVVIGETCEIGCHVRIYQGVTLGALSLENARSLAGKKRHPTIKNNVIIYAGASILGGDTVIGNNVTIGSNVFITSSIDDNCIVKLDNKNYKITNK